MCLMPTPWLWVVAAEGRGRERNQIPRQGEELASRPV